LDTVEICHKTKDLDLITHKIYHQDLEEVSEEKIQEDHQEEEAIQGIIIIITQED